MDELQWNGDLAADIHQTLRMKELQLPVYKARSPQIGMRRYFIDFLTVFTNRFDLCPATKHLAIYLLDLLMDRYDMTAKQLYIVSVTCLLLASKFEERVRKIPKLDQINSLADMYNVNVVFNKNDLFRMETLLLKNFDWNLCLPTPAHYIDYYLYASVGENDMQDGWPITSVAQVKAFLEKYAYYFLDLSVQDPLFHCFRPSLIAAACVCASRICMQIYPAWTAQLELLTCYSWEHLAQCTEMMLIYYDNDINADSNVRNQVAIQHQEEEIAVNLSCQVTTQVLFQQSSYDKLAQHSAVLSLFQSPMQDLFSAYRKSLQAHGPSSLLAGSTNSNAALQTSLWPSAQALPIQTPTAVQVALGAEPGHCISAIYGTSYFSGHDSYAAGCFDG